MTEIKFRAWNKRKKIFIGNDYRDNRESSSVDADEYYDDVEMIAIDAFNWLAKNDNFEIQFYTGINDKNDKPIYDGDLLYLDGYKKNILLASFNNKNYAGIPGWNCLHYGTINDDKILIFDKMEPFEFYYGWPPDSTNVIIGNIFEGINQDVLDSIQCN